MHRTLRWSSAILGSVLAAVCVYAADLAINTGSAPYAPLDISKKDDALVPLSRSQRTDLIKEFKGLVAMGLQSHSYDRWSWRQIADCYEPEVSRDSWKHKCEIITGQGNGYYFFYEGNSRREATLQRVEIRLQTSDKRILEELKPPLRELFGAPGTLLQQVDGYRSVGPIRHWNTGRDIADLFLDGTQSPHGTLRFVWNRGPLIRTQQAQLPRTGN